MSLHLNSNKISKFSRIYGSGWNRRSGKKLLNIAQIVNAKDVATTASTGANERYRTKKFFWSPDFCTIQSP